MVFYIIGFIVIVVGTLVLDRFYDEDEKHIDKSFKHGALGFTNALTATIVISCCNRLSPFERIVPVALFTIVGIMGFWYLLSCFVKMNKSKER